MLGHSPSGILIKVMQGCEDAGDEEDWEKTAFMALYSGKVICMFSANLASI